MYIPYILINGCLLRMLHTPLKKKKLLLLYTKCVLGTETQMKRWFLKIKRSSCVEESLFFHLQRKALYFYFTYFKQIFDLTTIIFIQTKNEYLNFIKEFLHLEINRKILKNAQSNRRVKENICKSQTTKEINITIINNM